MTSHPNGDIAAKLEQIEQAGGGVIEYSTAQGMYWCAECPCGMGHIGLVSGTDVYTITLDDMIVECPQL